MTGKISEEELQKIRDGNEEEFEDLFLSYRRFIYSQYSGVKDKYSNADLDEFMQVGRLAIHDAVMTYRDDRNMSFHTYVMMKICYRLADLKRTLRHHMYVNNVPIVSYDNNFSDEEERYLATYRDHDKRDDPEAKAMARIKIGEIHGILNDVEKKIFALRAQGYTYKEIADRLNCGVKKIDNTVQSIRKKVSSY